MEIEGLHGTGSLGAAECSDFGPVFHEFKGKPKAAILHLMKVQNGEVPGAFYHSEIGEIDLVWGENDTKNKGYGLKHIMEKHQREFESWGLKIEDVLPVIIQSGKINYRESDKNHKIIEHNVFRGVIRLDWNGKRKKFIICAYEKKKAGLSGSPTSDSPGLRQGDEMALPHPSAKNKDNTSAIKFQCSGCGICCQKIGKAIDKAKAIQRSGAALTAVQQQLADFPHPILPDGSCSKLNALRECRVYDNRPAVCSVAKTYGIIGKPAGISEQQYFELNGRMCNAWQNEAGMHEKFRVKENYAD